ncbi:hypothetical protein ACQ86E_04420 [Bradyrhizobium betae]|uniref:hypothetical protein n=1 Tax=Bradyrhizobium betae TaxID=244734 RepID=UPI003D678589
MFLLLASMQSVDAQQQSSKITLRCTGTSRFVGKPGAELEFTPLSNLSIIVSDLDQTVSFQDKIVPITKITPLLVGFSSQHASGRPTISGRIDRLTKSVEIDWKYENVGENTHWELECSPEGPFRDWG